MPFVKFKNKKEYEKAFNTWFNNVTSSLEERLGPITYLAGKKDGSHNAIHVYPSKLLDLLDKNNVNYTIIKPQDVNEYLSDKGIYYLHNILYK